MAKLRFVVVGSGWRSLFYWRIAQALPERFELCAMLCRTEEKAEKMHREYGVPVSTSAEQCIALHPDLVVVAVNKASIAAVSTEWLARGFAVLCETPAALEEDALRALWQLHQQGAKLQVAEQYWLYPTLAKRLAAVHSGALGTPQFARLSVAHGYHAVSLARQFLNAGQQPVRVTGRSWTERIIETDSRWGAVHNGALVEKTLQQHTLEFAGGGTAFLDFNGVQYHSYLRSTHTSVQGERGEVFDDTLRCLDAAGEPVCRQLTPLPDPLAAAAAQAGLNEDETAIACFLDRMQGYLAGGAEVYPLADALQDRLPCPADGAFPCRRSAAGKHPAAVEYRRTIKKAQKHLSALLSLLIYNDWITSGRSVLPPRPCRWPSWWRCAPRCGCRRTFPRSRTLPCLPAQPAGRFPAQGRSGWWGSP